VSQISLDGFKRHENAREIIIVRSLLRLRCRSEKIARRITYVRVVLAVFIRVGKFYNRRSGCVIYTYVSCIVAAIFQTYSSVSTQIRNFENVAVSCC